ncbi:hypothetical protein TNCV_3624781 [Trichonephila clavipes]|nr:hypothetical protein TNCV_3624781 [Trichonephila clavipes]
MNKKKSKNCMINDMQNSAIKSLGISHRLSQVERRLYQEQMIHLPAMPGSQELFLEEVCLACLDNMIIVERSFEEHLNNIRRVLQKLKEANLKLSHLSSMKSPISGTDPLLNCRVDRDSRILCY